MKFYYNGKLVRTSKNHEYTHAAIVVNDAGEMVGVLGCGSKKETCERIITSAINDDKTGIENAKKAIAAIKAGKTYFTAKAGRYTISAPVKTIEVQEGRIKSCEDHIECIKNHWKVVELTTEEQGKETSPVELDESMVSNFVEFNNCGEFEITISGKTYRVKFDNLTKTIETDAPCKDQIEKWWFTDSTTDNIEKIKAVIVYTNSNLKEIRKEFKNLDEAWTFSEKLDERCQRGTCGGYCFTVL